MRLDDLPKRELLPNDGANDPLGMPSEDCVRQASEVFGFVSQEIQIESHQRNIL